MTNTNTTDSIASKTERLETIIEQLEDGDVSLDRANELHEEGQELLAELDDQLDIGDGTVIEQS